MSAKLANQVIVITGASSGIGAAIAQALAPQKPRLVLAARNEDKLREVACQCEEQGTDTLVVRTDVTNLDDCRSLIDETVRHFGRLDILINNAGAVVWSRLDELRDVTKLDDLMRLNYLGSAYCTYCALSELKKSRGRIVAIASIAGLTGVPELSAYCATKHAMFGFFDSLRIELEGSGVTVTVIAPDFTQSNLFDNATGGTHGVPPKIGLEPKRLMTAETLAKMVVRAIERRQRLLVATPRGHVTRWAKLVAPRVVDFFTTRAAQGK